MHDNRRSQIERATKDQRQGIEAKKGGNTRELSNSVISLSTSSSSRRSVKGISYLLTLAVGAGAGDVSEEDLREEPGVVEGDGELVVDDDAGEEFFFA